MQELGGVNLEIDLYDDDNDPARAVQIAQQIANSNAVAVIGHSSIETLEAAQHLQKGLGEWYEPAQSCNK